MTAANGNLNLVEEGRNRQGIAMLITWYAGTSGRDRVPIIAGQSSSHPESARHWAGTRYHPLMVNVVKDLAASAMSALGVTMPRVVRQD